jgi:hypothetical protein
MLDHKMPNKWTIVRIVLIAVNAIPFSRSNEVTQTLSYSEVIGVFSVCLFAIPLLAFMLTAYIARASNQGLVAIEWSQPSWMKNPFAFTEPSQLFHLAAFLFMALGISRILTGPETLISPSSGFLFTAIGVGLWGGTWLAAVLWSRKRNGY